MIQISRSRLLWLIDVHQDCLVMADKNEPYVTLSYVWGNFMGLNCRRHNISTLQVPGAFSRLAAQLPETVKNAIGIVRLLGERYLWVDALCICQDDEETKPQVLSKMAAIYANSCLTIVAAEGIDANFGLRGIRNVSKPRKLTSLPVKFGGKSMFIRSIFPPDYMPETKYFDRGWTFQEYLFSRRRLIFERGSVRWECSQCAWSEDTVRSFGSNIEFSLPSLKSGSARYPSLSLYSDLIYDYNHRQLTYPEDALPAFLGVISLLNPIFPEGFLFGLPEILFEIALAWTPWHAVERRVSSGRSSTSATLTQLPSWSWIGWSGDILHCDTDMDYLKKGPFSYPGLTFPITEWYTGKKSTTPDKERRRISSKFLHERQTYKDLTLSNHFPQGWTRHEWSKRLASEERKRTMDVGVWELLSPFGLGDYYFTHDSIPEAEFWYPIPIGSPGQWVESPPQTPYLFANTYRLWLHAFGNDRSADDEITIFNDGVKGMGLVGGTNDKKATLLTDEGRWAGVLCLHRKEHQNLFTKYIPQELRQGPNEMRVKSSLPYRRSDGGNRSQVPRRRYNRTGEDYLKSILHDSRRVEVVAISKGLDPENRYEDGQPKEIEPYEFYNVLWVEWEDGVAYRKASGRVWKEAWEKQNPEPVALVLG